MKKIINAVTAREFSENVKVGDIERVDWQPKSVKIFINDGSKQAYEFTQKRLMLLASEQSYFADLFERLLQLMADESTAARKHFESKFTPEQLKEMSKPLEEREWYAEWLKECEKPLDNYWLDD